MAMHRSLIASLFISTLLLQLANADSTAGAGNNSAAGVQTAIDCSGACAARCSLSSRPRLCQRACGTCCARCQCVPPGTSGNLEVCPCYANMTTRDNKRKCP